MAYRDDLHALTAREQELNAELDALQRDLASHDARVARAAKVRRELEHLAPRIEGAKTRRALPLLSRVKVASPCKESWEGMEGDAHVRHCGKCDKNVYNLSTLTRDQAETLLMEREGELCVRFYRRHDGTIMTSDCPTGQRRRRLRNFALAATVTAGAGAAYFGTATTGEPCEVMGAMPMEVVQGGAVEYMGDVEVETVQGGVTSVDVRGIPHAQAPEEMGRVVTPERVEVSGTTVEVPERVEPDGLR